MHDRDRLHGATAYYEREGRDGASHLGIKAFTPGGHPRDIELTDAEALNLIGSLANYVRLRTVELRQQLEESR